LLITSQSSKRKGVLNISECSKINPESFALFSSSKQEHTSKDFNVGMLISPDSFESKILNTEE
jgi:hypothetical protein